jgi:hypothetical protein
LFCYIPILKKLVVAGNSFVRRGWMGPDVKIVLDTIHIRIPEMIARTIQAADCLVGLLERIAISS